MMDTGICDLCGELNGPTTCVEMWNSLYDVCHICREVASDLLDDEEGER